MPRLTRGILLPRLAAHLLAEGLAGAALRPMAKAAGTSDRMLIYHFGTKERLLHDTLAHVAAEMTARLDAGLPPGPQPDLAALARALRRLAGDPALSAHFALWLDLLASGDAGTAAALLDGFAAWVAARLPRDEADPDAAVAALLTLTEGIVVLDRAGRGAWADAALDRLLPQG
ncbi:TetR/AcrR family transcriptional regulator [Jannaschia sp. Os4]|uniref:TetR/AcrR family transcriptional regulator n=1 Tax=Jannaschia sp. Os4 TaxID=2807617 RepID=UPI00193AC11A|nr:TetR/AcrR family transcriptional regulator [Jannaschia sp. Os4]MBM2577484.1 TetR/AcrR family transcriptional regulator [Jannaschia sp. Os4]